MVVSGHNPSLLLKRVLSLSDYSPLILCIDSVAQTSRRLIEEISFNSKENSDSKVIFVSFETVDKPQYADTFIEAESGSSEKLIQTIKSYLPPVQQAVSTKYLVILDTINYIPTAHVSQFIASIASRHSTVLATYHADVPEYRDTSLGHYPSSLELLNFMATTILELSPILPKSFNEDQLKDDLSRLLIPRGLNNTVFRLTLTTRRRSGRSSSHTFRIDTRTHSYEIIDESKPEDNEDNENPEMLQGLTTFNLSTSAKQKLAKEQVELPFLEAQSFNAGGAIVYQFEKDDDYDEEDPFEDPF